MGLFVHASLIVAAIALAPSPGFSAETSKPPVRPAPFVKPVKDLKLRTEVVPASRAPFSLAPPMGVGGVFNAGGLASNGLMGRGLSPAMPAIADPAQQCRTTCTHARIICDTQDANSGCASRWGLCVAACRR